MKSWLRQHQYACRVALIRLLTQPFSSFTNITVVALALCVPLISWALLLAAQPVVQQIPMATEITVYLRADLSTDSSATIQKQLTERYASQLERIEIIDKNQAINTLKQDPTWADALSALPTNPLPDALILRLKSSSDQSQQAAAIANEIQEMAEVDRVQLDRDWLKRLDAILKFGQVALFLLSLTIGIIVVATVFNTIRLQALNQRQEITVARLVGATESFVRRPFLYVGAISGGISCLLAAFISLLILMPLNTALNKLALSYDTQIVLQLPPTADLLVAMLFIMVIAALAARWSVTRYRGHGPLSTGGIR